MATPEDDFATWLSIVSMYAGDLVSTANVFPDILRMAQSIAETGNLPGELSEHTDEFLDFLYPKFIKPILDKDVVDEDSFMIIFDILMNVVSFSVCGFTLHNLKIVQITEQIVANHTHQLYLSNSANEIRQTMAQIFAPDGYDLAVTQLDEDDPELFGSTVSVIVGIMDYVESFDLPQFSHHVISNMSKFCKDNWRKFASSIIVKVYNEIKSTMISASEMGTFVSDFLTFFAQMLETDLFEKKLTGLRLICDVLGVEIFTCDAINWLRIESNRESILNLSLHVEFMTPLARIYGYLIKNDIITMDQIAKLWDQQQHIHSTEISHFYSMFEIISNALSSDQIPDYIRILQTPKDKSAEWLNMLACLQLSDMIPVVDIFWELSFSPGPLREQARSKLPDLIVKQITTERLATLLILLLNQIEVSGSSSFITRMMSQLISLAEITNTSLLNELLDFCFVEADGTHSRDAFVVLESLVKTHHVDLTDHQLDRLFSLKRNPNFLVELYQLDKISQEYLESFFESAELDHPALKQLLSVYIGKLNFPKDDTYITCYPLLGEEIIWRFIDRGLDIVDILTYTYAQNNYYFVSDKSMIDIFFFQWHNHFQPNKPQYLRLMLDFLQRVEQYADVDNFGVKRHQTIPSDYVDVSVTGPLISFPYRLRIPRSMNLTVFLNKIGGFLHRPANSILVTRNGYVLGLHEPVVPSYPVTNSCSVYITEIPLEQRVFVRPLRSVLPSQMFSDSRHIDQVVSLLHKEDRAAKQLLDFLPNSATAQSRVFYIARMVKVPYDLIFPPDSPLLFQYMLEILIQVMTPALLESLETTSGVSYFISQFTSFDHVAIFNLLFTLFEQLSDAIITKYSNDLLFHLIKIMIGANGPLATDITKRAFNLATKIANLVKTDFVLGEPAESDLILFTPDTKVENFPPPSSFIGPLPEIDYSSDVPTVYPQAELVPLPDDKLTHFLDFYKDAGELTLNRVFANLIYSFVICPDIEIANSCQHFLEPLTIPESYFTPYLAYIEPKSTSFVISLCQHIKTESPVIIEYVTNYFDCKEKMFPIALKIADHMLRENLMDGERLFAYLADTFLTFDRPDIDSPILADAFKVLALAPKSMLLPRLQHIEDESIPMTQTRIKGDDITLNPGCGCGLVNLGMTCFLNATLQQFFAIPELRKRVISYQGDDEFLVELRALFSNMRETRSSSVNTEQLAAKWKGWDGQPLNPRIQQDAHEFVEMLIDKLVLIGANELFTGMTVASIDGITVDFHTERKDTFTTLGLSMSGVTNIDGALDLLHSPDFFTDKNQYSAEGLGKIDAKQTEYIDKLPDHLIIQLRRFEIDYTSYDRKKINTRMSFPNELDLSKHLRNPQPAPYHLTGIIIHRGTASSGHYYSYIKQRDTNEWLCFNDRNVRKASESEVRNDAEGSTSDVSGYLFFYERDGLVEVDDSEVPPEMKDPMEKEAQITRQSRLICHSQYGTFMNEIAKRDDDDLVMSTVKYAFEVCPHTFYDEKGSQLLRHIHGRLHGNEEYQRNVNAILETTDFTWTLIHPPSSMYQRQVSAAVCFLLNTFHSHALMENVWSLFDEAVKDITELDIMGNIISTFDDEFGQRVVERLVRVFTQDIVRAKQDMSKVRIEYMYKSLDLSGICEVIARYPLSDAMLELLRQPDYFLQMMSMSRTHFVCLYEKLDNARDIIITFYEKNAVNLSIYSAAEVLITLFGSETFAILPKLQFKVGQKMVTSLNIVFCYLVLINKGQCSDFLVSHLGEWMPEYLFSESLDTRRMCQYVFAALAPAKVFKILPEITVPDHNYSPGDFTFWLDFDKLDDHFAEKANKAFETLIEMMPRAIETLVKQIPERENGYFSADKYWVSDYLFTLGDYLKFIPDPERALPAIESLALVVTDHCHPYDPHVRSVCQAFNTLKAAPPPKFLENVLFDFDLQQAFYQRVISIHESLFAILDGHFTDEMAAIFFKTITFAPVENVRIISHKIHTASVKLAAEKPHVVRDVLQQDFDKYIARNISMVIEVMAVAEMKWPHLIDYITAAGGGSQYLTYEQLVIKAIPLTEDGPKNMSYVIPLVLMGALTPATRKLVWDIIATASLDDFLMCTHAKYPLDFIETTTFLMQFPDDPRILTMLVTCASKSADAFAISYDLLMQRTKEIRCEVFAFDLSKHVGHSPGIVVRFVNEAFPRATLHEKARFISPVIVTASRISILLKELNDNCNDQTYIDEAYATFSRMVYIIKGLGLDPASFFSV